MSYKNRKAMYEQLVKEGKLSQDDGSLVKEFGPQPTIEEPKEEPKKKGRK